MVVQVLNVLFARGAWLIPLILVAAAASALGVGRKQRFFLPRGAGAIAIDAALGVVFVAALAAGYFTLRVRHELGARITAWELRSASTGATRTLVDYRGKPVVLNLWATWCGPCREEMPALNALAAEHRSGDAIVLAATDESLEDIRRFEDREMRVAAEVVTFKDERPPYGPLGAMAYEGRPTTIVLDRNGAVRHVFAGPQSLATFEDALRDAL